MRIRAATAWVLTLALLAGCVPAATVGTLAPTLVMTDVGGLAVPMQSGRPVPTFSWQPRPRIDLDGPWLVEPATLDPQLTMTDREASLPAIEEEAHGRQAVDYDDSSWGTVNVPGTVNPPPDGEEGGAWYRRAFSVPLSWSSRSVTLKLGSANYVADVWLNGTWLGYHEGGSTPFAFDVGHVIVPGERNVLAIRVHTIPLGTRSDVVPWGLIDWWNYGGLTGPVWLEAQPAVHLARVDVVPHLDAADVSVLLYQPARLAGTAGEEPPPAEEVDGMLRATVLPATVSDDNLLDPDPRSLVADASAPPLLVAEQEVTVPRPGEVTSASVTFQFRDADAWSPARPALYVLHVELLPLQQPLDAREAIPPDSLWTTFGIRHVAVDPVQPRVLLNGEAAFFRGVGLHEEALTYAPDGSLADGSPAQSPQQALGELEDARRVGADLVRTGHQPASPTTLMLADRLGFAVWEEIPLYHASPFIFQSTMERGIPQQMLREMALRDMNHPSVLFHGFANESTGDDERTAALAELHEVDRAIDGTRLTGQAAYGWRPTDPTHAPLDVAGFTFYWDVFYGDDAGPDTRRALREAHEANPEKPIMILEFGRWADTSADEIQQRRIFAETYPALEQYRADEPGGFVSAATWWTLHDFATQIAGIGVEDFGLFRPDGSLRPAGELAVEEFSAPAGRGSELDLEPDLQAPRVVPPSAIGDWTLAAYLAYGLTLSIGTLGLLLALLVRRGGRAVGRRR